MLQRAFVCLPLALCACDTTMPTFTRNNGTFYNGLNIIEVQTPNRVFQKTLETKLSGQALTWRLASGASGKIEPTATWKSTTDHWCRSFRETITVPAQGRRTRSGTACRVNETWKTLES